MRARASRFILEPRSGMNVDREAPLARVRPSQFSLPNLHIYIYSWTTCLKNFFPLYLAIIRIYSTHFRSYKFLRILTVKSCQVHVHSYGINIELKHLN